MCNVFDTDWAILLYLIYQQLRIRGRPQKTAAFDAVFGVIAHTPVQGISPRRP
jgi:hypothetical protein